MKNMIDIYVCLEEIARAYEVLSPDHAQMQNARDISTWAEQGYITPEEAKELRCEDEAEHLSALGLRRPIEGDYMPYDHAFVTERGTEELCHATGYEVCDGDPANPADWWNEYKDWSGTRYLGR